MLEKRNLYIQGVIGLEAIGSNSHLVFIGEQIQLVKLDKYRRFSSISELFFHVMLLIQIISGFPKTLIKTECYDQ